MKLTLEIRMDNAAFDDGNQGMSQAALILRDAAKFLEMGDPMRGLMDENGNSVGRYEIED